MSDFSKLLRKLRDERKKTQNEVALSIGTTQQSFRRYESGERLPDIEILQKLAEYFDVSADYLLGLAKYPTRDLEIQNAIEITGLSEDAINKLRSYSAFMPCINFVLENDTFYKIMQVFADTMTFWQLGVKDKLESQRIPEKLMGELDSNKSLTDEDSAYGFLSIFRITQVLSQIGLEPILRQQLIDLSLELFEEYKAAIDKGVESI